MSFLDVHKGCHQVPLVEEDTAKTNFVIDHGIYFYA